jgi:hypothetical protein
MLTVIDLNYEKKIGAILPWISKHSLPEGMHAKVKNMHRLKTWCSCH